MTPHRAARSTLGVLASLIAGAALAQSSPYYLGGALTYSHDSNLLRLADKDAVPVGNSKADSTVSTALLAGLDQSFGRQRAYGTLTLRSNRFSKNTIYNNQSYALSAGLDWSTAERISGVVSVDASRNLSSFGLQEIGLLENKNQESNLGIETKLRMGLITEYSLEATIGTRQVKNTLDDRRVQARNNTQDNVSLGLRWTPSSDTKVGLAVRATRGRYPDFPVSATELKTDRLKREDLDLTFWHRPTGLSSVELRLSTGKTKYDLSTQRDFDGLTGSLGWNWQATGKVYISTRLSHDTGQDSYAYTFANLPATTELSRVMTSLRVQADYTLTAKLSLKAAVSYSDRDLVRTLPVAGGGTQERDGNEKSTAFSLGGRWSPYPYAQVGCDVRQETRRGSGSLGSNLGASTYSCFGQLTLQ